MWDLRDVKALSEFLAQKDKINFWLVSFNMGTFLTGVRSLLGFYKLPEKLTSSET